MNVVFNAKTINGKTLITNEQKKYWEQIIIYLVNEFSKQIDTTNLQCIVIPEEYKVELFEYQKKVGVPQWCTDDDTARGMAQTISEPFSNGESQVIYFSKEMLIGLLDDNLLEELKETMSNEEYETLTNSRALAINILHHELAHVQEEHITSKIKWIRELDENNKLFTQQLRKVAMMLWREYYACRISASSHKINENDTIFIINLCKQIENEILVNRRKYNLREISLDDFVSILNKKLDAILKFSTYAYGNYFSLEFTVSQQIIDSVKELLNDTLFQEIWVELGIELDRLFTQYPNWDTINVLDNLANLLLEYIKKFNINVYDTEKGIYYDIPVSADLL